jgi:hypothetical protein
MKRDGRSEACPLLIGGAGRTTDEKRKLRGKLSNSYVSNFQAPGWERSSQTSNFLASDLIQRDQISRGSRCLQCKALSHMP